MPIEGAPRVAVILKGYPRLSETFIAQEILALEQRGFTIDIWSLRHPTDKLRHPMHAQIKARLFYLPEYLRDAPWRVARAAFAALLRPRLWRLLGLFAADLRRDATPNRARRFGQALVLARELDPAIAHLHVHFLHTPASVARYGAVLTGRAWSFSAHAKDIWTTPAWELGEKIADAAWGVTCTRAGLAELRRVADAPSGARVALAYHGLDLARFPPPPDRTARPGPVRLVSVGRAVAKKGFDDLLAALAKLADADWRLVQIGGGPLLPALKAQAAALGIADRIEWRGALAQQDVVAALREADLFVLASKTGADGDRDGLPNVIMEAASQALPSLATTTAGIPEFIADGQNGVLVPPGDPAALSAALARLIADPDLRLRLGAAAWDTLRHRFSLAAGIDLIAARLSGRPVAEGDALCVASSSHP
jgi:glycosyltransferase involved in cell wall biosynthesis